MESHTEISMLNLGLAFPGIHRNSNIEAIQIPIFCCVIVFPSSMPIYVVFFFSLQIHAHRPAHTVAPSLSFASARALSLNHFYRETRITYKRVRTRRQIESVLFIFDTMY